MSAPPRAWARPQQQATAGRLIRFHVRHGLGAMPSFSEEQISDSELNAIVSHLQALRQQEWPNTHLSIEAR
ncbi:MAG: cytochrome c [Pseudomonadota bacterium]|nr:cytochrome c [Pseudomonadota bacterium]